MLVGHVDAVQPIGTLGEGYLRQIQFLPDGTILRVLLNHLEIIDTENDVILARFAEQTEMIWRVIVSSDGRLAAIRTEKTAQLWDIVVRKKLHQWELGNFGGWSPEVLDVPFLAAFSETDSLLAINNGHDQITLWNSETGESLGRLQDKRRPIQWCYRRSGQGWSSESCTRIAPHVFSMAISPDGRFLVVGSKRPDAEIWNLQTRRLVGHLEGHGGWVSDVTYSPDGRWIATSEPESTKVYLWNTQTRQLVQTWRNGEIGQAWRVGEVFELFFSADSQCLYVVTRTPYPAYTNTDNDRVRVWDVETRKLVNEFRGEPTALKYVSASSDERLAILQYHDQVAVLWDMKQNRRIRLWTDYTARGTRMRLSPDNSSLVQIYPTLIKIWDVPSQSLREIVFAGEQNYRLTLAISPDSRRFVTGLYTNGTEVRDIETGQLEAHIPEARGWSALTFNHNGDRIATPHNRSNQVIILDVDSPIQQQLLENVAGTHIVFSKDDRYLAATDTRDTHRIHLWEKEAQGYSYRYAWRSSIDINSVFGDNLVFHPHSEPPILVGAAFSSVVAWQLGREAAEELFRVDGNGPLHFSADGRYLFLNGRDGLQIWDWQANTPLEHPAIPSYFDLSDNTSMVLTLDYEMGQIQIWNGIILLPVKPVAVELQGNQIVTLGGLKRNVLLQNFPNPFNPETWIPFRLEKENTVTINIYRHSGSLVRTLPYGMKPAGDYATREKAAYWDGKNSAGEPVASGMYFYTLITGDFTATRMMSIKK